MLAPRRTATLGAAGLLFCLAAALIGWASHALLQAQPAPAVAVPTSVGVSGTDGGIHQGSSRRDEHRAPRSGSDPPPRVTAPSVAAASQREPERIVIPALGVHQDLVDLSVSGTTLQVPDQYDDIGWWSGGPVPGEAGAAVVVGHVDSLTGPAVFYGLSSLRRGDEVRVFRENGSRVNFEVRKTILYDRDEFPSDRVYRSSGRPSLHLLTCGGSFDAEAGHYTGNVVVFAELIKRAGDEKRTQRSSDSDHDRHSPGHAR